MTLPRELEFDAVSTRPPFPVAAVVFAAAFLLVNLAARFVSPLVSDWSEAAVAGVNAGIPLVFAVVGAWLFRDAWSRSFRLTRERPWVTFGLFAAAIAGAFILPMVAALVVVLLGAAPTGANQAILEGGLGDAGARWMVVVAAVVVGPIVEELVFREALAWRLKGWLPAWVLIVGSSLLFALLHVRLIEDLATLLVYLAMGVCFVGVLWLSRGNLLLAISTHAVRNLLSVVMLLAIA